MKLVLFGIQGSGKSTQGNLLSKQLKVPYLSTGHILRQIAREKTKLGRYIKEMINAGILVPDEKMIEIVDDYLSRSEYGRGYILDGFPRTLVQVKKFKNHIDRAVYLKIPDRESLWRLAYRNDKTREDETIPAIKKRIELFHKFTEPVIKFYEEQKKLITIDGTKSIKDVNLEILKNLGKQLVKNQVQAWKRKERSIVAIVGLPGAGKTEAAKFFAQKGLPVISFGKVITDYVDQQGLKHTEEVHKFARESFREKYGPGALAVLNEEKIKQALDRNMIIAIDGMRSWEEYLYLKEKFPNVRIYILALYADKDIRYKRIASRHERSQLFGEERDLNELKGTNMGPTIAFADFLVKNNFTKEELFEKLEQVYRVVYFS